MKRNFSPSVNIVRDHGKRFHYLPTNNSRAVYQQITSNFGTGLHSFTIIGSYGTGKSAFLLAFTQHLLGEKCYFPPIRNEFNGSKSFQFINLVGEAKSFISALASALEVEADENVILQELKHRHRASKSNGRCFVLLVDEFGKFLEYAAANDPDRELYFIQLIAEYANDADRNFLFLTTLHQNFDAYAIGLQEAQRKEWEKVKGRLKELTFNEPVEQLLNLAAEYIGENNGHQVVEHDPRLLKIINETGAFKLLNEITEDFANSLYPFDLLSAMALTLALQKYGQNERSLFSFLQTEEHLGINRFQPSPNKPYYNLASVYDYLVYNYYSTLTSKFNPDYFKWTLVRNSVERIEVEFTERIGEAQEIVKAIGLLNILGSDAAKINVKLIETYALRCLGISNARSLLKKLEESKIILYQSFKGRYKLFEGTDVDIEQIQREAREEIGLSKNLVAELEGFFKLDFVLAKAISYSVGTPRIFQYKLSETPLLAFKVKNPEIDGFVNLLFHFDEELLRVQNEPILFGIFQRSEIIQAKVTDIKALELALSRVSTDRVASRELKELRGNTIRELNDLLHHQLFVPGGVHWYFDGKRVEIDSQRSFNAELSRIAKSVYPATPHFRNELMNKTKVSSSIHYAKKQFIEALIDQWNKPGLGFSEKGFPAEKTIYISLLKETGMHIDVTPFTADFTAPSSKSFKRLWKASLEFLESARLGKRNLAEFVRLLSQKPFKLKHGFIEFWLISFLFMKREEFALYKNGVYVPRITKEVAELFMREAKRYEIKTFQVEGVKLDVFNKYRELTQQHREGQISETGFQTTARPFLVFYKKLPKYTRNTRNLSHDTLAFRQVIANAKELEKMFFEDFPASFGLSIEQLSHSPEDFDRFFDRIQSSIAELRSAYENLVDRVEQAMLNELGYEKAVFEEYKLKIQHRYRSIKAHLLFPRQKSLVSRINSELPDKAAWINSIVHAVLGKQLDGIADNEEEVLYERLKTAFRELDDLTELSKEAYDESSEEALSVEITGFTGERIKRNVILAKRQEKAVRDTEAKVKDLFADLEDDRVKQAVLIRLLKQTFTNGKG